MIFKQQYYYAANYARLSDEDETNGESCSIDSQRQIMAQYCESKGIQVVDFYKDDGYSGTNFDRPDFKRMLSDIKSGKVNLVIVKDLSRFGRNYIDSGYYIEQVFDDYNVRLIAIDDSIDTLKGENMVMPIKNMMNDFYAKDISKKTRSALNARAKNGQYLASKPAYGYMKSPEDNHKLIVDPESSEVVREIFYLASTNYGYNAIVKHLTRKGILTPQSYLVTQNPEYFKKKEYVPHSQWNNKTVQTILFNPIYLGNLIYGKTRSKKIRSKDKLARPEEEWIIKENTHEPIISQKLWDTAHERLGSRKRETKIGEVHMFAGYIYCADCGAAMTFKARDFHKDLNGEFMCGSYRRKGKDFCSTHYVTYEKVYQMLIADLKAKSSEANQNEARFVKSLEQESEIFTVRKTSTVLKDVQQTRIRIEQLDKLVSNLFEEKILGNLSEERYIKLLHKYESEQEELMSRISEVEHIEKQQSEAAEKIQSFTEFIKGVIDMTELTPDILSKLIKRITIGQSRINPITGEKEQDIDIDFNIA